MPEIYLTPASISYLGLSTLALVITVYFFYRVIKTKGKTRPHGQLFIGVYASITMLSFLFALETAFLPTQRLLFVYFQNTALAILLVFLVQFAYHYPQKKSTHPTETRIALALTTLYVCAESGIAIWRYILLLRDAHVEYRSGYLDYFPMVIIAWVVSIFIRNWRDDKESRAHSIFASIILIPLWLVFIDSIADNFSREFLQINISVGLLLTTFFFAFNYASYLPEITPFIAKISGTFLLGTLSTLSIVAWLITPAYSEEFSPRLADYRTLQFSPNAAGGYDVREIAFQFETDLGQRTNIGSDIVAETVPFPFTFFGKNYTEVHVSEDGAINFGSYQRAADVQYNFGKNAKLSPAYIDLVAPQGGEAGVYTNISDSRLIVTWYKMQVFHDKPQTMTMQVILQPDSSFTFTYNGLPSLNYNANIAPGEKVWMLGIKPERQVAATANYSQLPFQVPPNGALQDEYRAFRGFLDKLMRPMAISLLLSTLVLLVVLPVLVELGLSRPLGRLLKGMETFNEERKAVNLPVPGNDEIGYLTQSFNTLTDELAALIANLETRVEARTVELVEANQILKETQNEMLEQQRAFTRIEERQRMARDMHDSVNQSIHSLVLSSDTLLALLKKERPQDAIKVAERIHDNGEQALREIRLLIYRAQSILDDPGVDVVSMLEARLNFVERRVGVAAEIIGKDQVAACGAIMSNENLYWLITEALNNSLKYSQAHKITVSFRYEEGLCKVLISDDGIGFEPESMSSGGFGFHSMRERAQLLGGNLSITSAPGNGTQVHLQVKLEATQ